MIATGRIDEIDRGRWRGREEKLSGAYYYVQEKYAKDSVNIKSPQAVVKVIGYRHGSQAVRGTIEYIARLNELEKEELELQRADGRIIAGKDEIAALVKEWKADFEKSPNMTHIKGDGAELIKEKRQARHATHILLSADCEPNEQNYNKLEFAAREFLQREFDDKGYDYLFVVHKDTQHPHVHIVIKNKQREMGLEKRGKLRLNPNDLLHLRRQFAYELEREGIEQIATRSVDDPKRCLKALQNRIDGARKNLTWYQSKMQEPDWNKDATTDLQRYASNLQRELTRVRQLTIEAKMPLKDKRELAKEYKKLLDEIGTLRQANKTELARQSVERFKARANSVLQARESTDSVLQESKSVGNILQASNSAAIADNVLHTSNTEASLSVTTPAPDQTEQTSAKDRADLLGDDQSKSCAPITEDQTDLLSDDQSKTSAAIASAIKDTPLAGKIVALRDRIGKAATLERKDRLLEYRHIQRQVKIVETEIRKEPDYKTRKALFLELGQLRHDLYKLRREPKPSQKALNEYGLDLNFNHASAVKVGEARTARGQVKEANAGIVVIERQIAEAEQTIKSITESKIDSKERKRHIKDLETIRDRFLEGYVKHIKESGKLVEAAIAADKTLKAMPPSVKRKERELLYKTMESYNATLDKSTRFVDRGFSGLNRFAVSREIRDQRTKIERSFDFGLGL
jgi:hypothetical protein